MSDHTRLLGISNAIVDVLSHVDEDLIERVGAPRGSMTLIDEARAHEIYDMMGPATEMSGGSVANTIAGFANLGGSLSPGDSNPAGSDNAATTLPEPSALMLVLGAAVLDTVCRRRRGRVTKTTSFI